MKGSFSDRRSAHSVLLKPTLSPEPGAPPEAWGRTRIAPETGAGEEDSLGPVLPNRHRQDAGPIFKEISGRS